MKPGPLLLAAAAVTALAVSACTAAPLSAELGEIPYVKDKEPTFTPASWLYAGADIDTLAAGVDDLGSVPVSQRLAQVDRNSDLVVSVYYDACSKAAPALDLHGTTLSVRFVTLDRNCVRAEDTLALFSVRRSSLPDPLEYTVCGRTVTLSGDQVSGESAGAC